MGVFNTQAQQGVWANQSTPVKPVFASPFTPQATVEPAAGPAPVFGLGTPGGWSATVANYNSSPLGQFMRQRQMEAMAAAGITGVDWADFNEDNPLNDPEVQRQANETALAKIATANPDLAQQLAAKMQAEPEDKSLWDNLKDLGGDILSPVVSIGGKLLDIISRPARIIPELITDEEGDPWYEDIGQALGGNSNASWSKVLDQWGVENNVVKAVGGFVGDVLTDPLTYLSFGTLGLGRQVASQTAGRTVAANVLRKGLVDMSDDAADVVVREFSQRLTNMAGISADASPAFIARHLGLGVDDAILTRAIQAGDETTRMLQRGMRGKSVLGDEAYGILKATAAGRTGAEAKAAASALGGMRFRATVPFTQHRLTYTSGALPFTEGRKFIGLGGNFFRGTSGMTRLQVFLNNNPSIPAATKQDMFDTWVKEGYRGFQKKYTGLMSEMGNGSLGFGSMFFEASSRVGRVTANLTPHSNIYRHGGLVGTAALNAGRSAMALQNKLRESAYELWEDADGPAMNKVAFEKVLRPMRRDPDQRKYIEWLSLASSRQVMELGDDELMDVLTSAARRRRDVQIQSIDAREASGNLDAGTAMRERRRIQEEFVTEAEMALVKRGRMRAAHAALTPEQKDAVEAYRRGLRQMLEAGDVHGAKAGDHTTTIDFADRLNDADTAIATRYGNQDVARAKTYAVVAGEGPRVGDVTNSRYGLRGLVFGVDRGAEPSSVIRGTSGSINFSAADVDELVRKADADGGFTVDATSKKYQTTGKAVAEPLDEIQVPLVGGSEQVAKRLNQYLDKHKDILSSDEYFLGGWREGDNLVLDISRVYENADEAAAMSVRNNQRAYFDLDTGSTITPRSVAVRAENPLVIRAKGATTDQPLLDAWRADTERGIRHANPNLDEDAIQDKLNEALAKKAKDDGYDSIIEFDETDNLVGGVLLVDDALEKGIPMWVRDSGATQVIGDRGYFPHMMTDELSRAIKGERGETEDILPGELVHAKARTSDEDFFRLNERLKEEYGITNGEALKSDLMEVYDLYAHRMATGAAQAQLRQGAESLLGTYGSAAPEMVTFLNRYAKKGFLDESRLARAGEQVVKHHQKLTEQNERVLKAQENLARRYIQEVEALERGLLGESGTALAAGSRAVGSARAREGVDLGKQIKATMTKIAKLKSQAKNAQKGEKVQRLETELRNAQKQLDTLLAQRKTLGTGRSGPTTPEYVGKAQAKQVTAFEKELGRFTKRTGKAARQLERAQVAAERTAKELNVIRTRLETHSAIPTPAFTTDGTKAGYVALTGVPELSGLYVHPYIGAEFTDALKGKSLTAIRKEWRRFQGVWKSWATVYYPGFHARNNLGAWFNNWLGGVSSGHYAYSHRMSNALKDGKWANKPLGDVGSRFGIDPNITWKELGEMAHSMGIRSSNSLALADMQDAVGALRRMRGGKETLRERATASAGRSIPARAARKGTELTENFHRQAAFLRGLEVTGGDYAGARAFTMMRHGDYEDLNDFEHFIKDIVPFYKWMRTNIPFQLRQLVEAPGKQLATMKAGNAMFVAAGEDPEAIRGKLGRGAAEAFNIALPRGIDGDEALQLISLDLPMADLFQGGSDFISAALPLVRPWVEAYVLKQNTFTGAPLTGKRKPLAGWMQLPVIEQLLSPFTDVDANGQKVMSDQTQTILNTIPIFSRFRNWAFADENSQERRVGALMSAFFGVRPEDFNQEDLLNHEKAFYYEQIEPMINELRNLGVALPEPGMLSPSIYTALGFDVPVEEGE